jgi:NAD(P)H-hydrate epimerase
VIAGSEAMAGAAMMTSRAAIEAGAGLVSVATQRSVVPRIHAHCPEVMAQEDSSHHLKHLTTNADCVGVGPGLGQDARAQRLVEFALTQTSCSLVLDADALNIIATDIEGLAEAATTRPIVLTPHPGEMARLCHTSIPEIIAAPVMHARRLAARTQCIIVLKLSTTLIVSPEGRIHISSTGNPGMATGGMGDTLTGIICAMLARRTVDPFMAASLGVYLHGSAADTAHTRVGALGLTATRTLDALGEVFARTEQTQ